MKPRKPIPRKRLKPRRKLQSLEAGQRRKGALVMQAVRLNRQNRRRKRNGSAAGLWHMANVKAVGCVICCRYAEAHHPLTMRQGSRASDLDTIALCFNHHSAQTPLAFGEAIHKGTETFCQRYGSEELLLAQTRLKLRLAGLPDGSDLEVLLAFRAKYGRQPIPPGHVLLVR